MKNRFYIYHFFFSESFPGGSVVKNLPVNAGDAGDAGDVGLIPGLGRSSRGGSGKPF